MATPYTNPFHDSETTLRSILSNPLKSTSSRTLDIYIYIYQDTVEAHSGYTPFRQKGSSVKFKKRKKKKEKEEKRWRETHERTR